MLRKSVSVLLSCLLVFSVLLLPVAAIPETVPGEFGRINVSLKTADRIYTADDFPGIDIEKLYQWDIYLEIYITDKTKDGTDAAMEKVKDALGKDAYTYIIQDYLLLREVDTAPGKMIGDVNSDDRINLTDAQLILKYIADWDVEISQTAADFNADGKINLTDTALILKHIAKWDIQ